MPENWDIDTMLMSAALHRRQVKGIYFGVPFTGVAVSSRMHTVSGREIVTIQLDHPINVLDLERTQISMWASEIQKGTYSLEISV